MPADAASTGDTPLSRARRVAPVSTLIATAFVLLAVAAGGCGGVLLCQGAVRSDTLLDPIVEVGFDSGVVVGSLLAVWPLLWLLAVLSIAAMSGDVPAVSDHDPTRSPGQRARALATRGWRGVTTAWLCTVLLIATGAGAATMLHDVGSRSPLLPLIAVMVIALFVIVALLLAVSPVLVSGFVAGELPHSRGVRAVRLWQRASRVNSVRHQLALAAGVVLPVASGTWATAFVWQHTLSALWPLLTAIASCALLVLIWPRLIGQLHRNYLRNRKHLAGSYQPPTPIADARLHDGDAPPPVSFNLRSLLQPSIARGDWQRRTRQLAAIATVAGALVCGLAWSWRLAPHGWMPATERHALLEQMSCDVPGVDSRGPWLDHADDLMDEYAALERRVIVLSDEAWLRTFMTSISSNIRRTPLYDKPPDNDAAILLLDRCPWIDAAIDEWRELSRKRPRGRALHTGFFVEGGPFPLLVRLFRLRLVLASQAGIPAALEAIDDLTHLLLCTRNSFPPPGETCRVAEFTSELTGEISAAMLWMLEYMRPQLDRANLRALDQRLVTLQQVQAPWSDEHVEALIAIGTERPPAGRNPLQGWIHWRNACHRAWIAVLRCRSQELRLSPDPAVRASLMDHLAALAPSRQLAAQAEPAPSANAWSWWGTLIGCEGLNVLRIALRVEATILATGKVPSGMAQVQLEPWPAPPIDPFDLGATPSRIELVPGKSSPRYTIHTSLIAPGFP